MKNLIIFLLVAISATSCIQDIIDAIDEPNYSMKHFIKDYDNISWTVESSDTTIKTLRFRIGGICYVNGTICNYIIRSYDDGFHTIISYQSKGIYFNNEITMINPNEWVFEEYKENYSKIKNKYILRKK